MKKIQQKISKLKLNKILFLSLNERTITVRVNNNGKRELNKLDGCYVVKTNSPFGNLDSQTVHDRYKDLAKVEFAFRTMKTTLDKINYLKYTHEGKKLNIVSLNLLEHQK